MARPTEAGAEHGDAPQAVDDAGHRGEQVDQVAQRLRDPARREVGDEQRHGRRASGVATISAMTADRIVPKTQRRDVGDQAVARRAARRRARRAPGTASAIRKTATPARTTRMRTPAPRARLTKTRSPTCWTGLAAGAAGRGVGRTGHGGSLGRRSGPGPAAATRSRPGGRPGWTAQAPAVMPVTAGVICVRSSSRQRRGAGRLRRGLLAVRAGGVGEEALHQVRLGRVGVLRAGDLVGDQHDRVGARRGGVAGEVEGEAAVAAALDARRTRRRRSPRPRRSGRCRRRRP